MYRIPLHVSGVDLKSPETLEVIEQCLTDVVWTEVSGRVLAIVYTDSTDRVGEALQAVRKILHKLPTAVVYEVDQDLVNISDIAHRIGFTREAVRNWVDGKRGPGGFPIHCGTPGGDQKVWRWGAVAGWLEEHYGLVEDDKALPGDEIARINSAIQRVVENIDYEWDLVQIASSMTTTAASTGVAVDKSLPRHITAALKDKVLSGSAQAGWGSSIRGSEISAGTRRRDAGKVGSK
ncbi:hypothetical protein [Catelliglobosispora koreensis]|uniref:hypothetical protein n=1 Tax=Catelliglobosispora koreensis TaxID=129052 RepID=UPI00037F554B|nr:hypothetical protein [Catelliglobosispora koreensis]